ncbi:HDOD domain-containing protein [Desulfobulbus rhabdoformis]|uniref:response regulator n=1 Tax=Desulfobulbus rhabdoformis TaxID=34032 RepID=UPI001962F7DE|nr:response regulator [Desulfobulbus rhabdoformis]MBM9614556.1 HDOD domain-containing protein [Desulfobulbus rhabdoformis]
MPKKSILFVDDEPNILSGLRRMFRTLRREKDFHFLESGQAALDFMAENNVDVIVSDMRMPGMDGASLLTKVQEEYPRTIRIMLTGQADEESILRTVGVVHQFISKPSTPETLREIIDRACALQDLMENEQLKSVVSGIGQLPSLPEVYSKLQNKMKDPECSLADVAAIIEQDLAMSTKVLQLVNSSFFGFFKNIDSPTRAVNLLGLDTVKALVLSVGIFSEIKPLNAKHFSIQQLWDHSVAVAAYTKKIVQTETDSKEMLDHSFLAGFLHDIGKLILVSSLTDKYIEATKMAHDMGMPLCVAEFETLNATHSDVGGYLLGLWGLPGDAVETAAFHHRLDHYPNPSFCPPLAVHAADAIYYRLHPEKAPGEIMLSMEYLEKAGVSNRFEHWQELCEELGL